MHLSFDIPSGKTIARAMLIPSGLGINQELPAAFILAQTTSRTFMDVEVTKLQQLMIQGANVSLTVRIEMTDGSVLMEETNGFEVKAATNLQDFSVLEGDDPRKNLENFVLNALNNHFVLQGTGWRRTIASPFHLGEDKKSADFNLDGGNDDIGQPVTTPADGIVVKNEKDSYGNSVLIIKHDTNGTVWYSKYLHMQNINVALGDNVKTGDAIGEVGKVSDDSNMAAHLHLEIYGEDGVLIDLRNMLDAKGIVTKAWDGNAGGEIKVEWNEELSMWMGAEDKNAGLAFIVDPNTYTEGQNNVWVAWHLDANKRATVIWKVFKVDGEPEARGHWVNQNQQNMIWNGTDWITYQ